MTKTLARSLPLGKRIAWARRRRGISQERLAEIVGTTRRHMIRIEKGETARPRQPLLARIAEATDQPESFFDDDDDEESDTVSLEAAAKGLVSALTAEIRRVAEGASA